jgi:hypothetical protein
VDEQLPLDRTGQKQRAHLGVRDIEVSESSYAVTIFANEVARDPVELKFDGLQTENYNNNPVVLWSHNNPAVTAASGGIPIARTLELKTIGPKSLRASFEFLENDPFVARVKNAWDQGFVRAASIAWYPLEYEANADGTGWIDYKSDLLEWSLVPVPADSGALREAHARMIEAVVADPESADAIIRVAGDLVIAPSADSFEPAVAVLRELMAGPDFAERVRAILDEELASSVVTPRSKATMEAVRGLRALARETRETLTGGA